MTFTPINTEARVQVALEAVGAYAAGAADRLAALLAADVVFRPSAFLTGIAEYRGRDQARQGLLDAFELLRRDGKRLRLRSSLVVVDRADPSLVLTLGHIEIVRPSGDSFGSQVAHLWRFEEEFIAGLGTWLDHATAIDSLEDPAMWPADATRPGPAV